MSASALAPPSVCFFLWFYADHLYDHAPADLLLDLCALCEDQWEDSATLGEIVIYRFPQSSGEQLGRIMARLTYHGCRFTYYVQEVAHVG